jgi:hypothetical protein
MTPDTAEEDLSQQIERMLTWAMTLASAPICSIKLGGSIFSKVWLSEGYATYGPQYRFLRLVDVNLIAI